jgi:TolA-binding protein
VIVPAGGCRRRGCAFWGALSLLATYVPALAQSGAELQRSAEGVGRELTAVRRSGTLDTATELKFAERLGPLVLGFIDESDRAARAGTEQPEALRPVFESIHEPLNAIQAGRSARLERMAQEVMNADGDLEALYESSEWKESQRVAASSLYYLNWLTYYGARLYDGERRKELLEAAERGFSQFAVGDRKTDLLTESLLGRALCHLELGNYEWAIRDFGIVVEEPNTSEERKTKARLGKLEALARSGKVSETLRYSGQLLDSGTLTAGDAAIARFFRLQALFNATKSAAGGDAERYRRETLTLMQELRGAGPGWAQKVDALMLTSIDDPERWANRATTPLAKWQLATMLVQRGKELEAVPLLEDVVSSGSSEVAPYRAEASYLLGVVRFKSGRYQDAADLFATALKGPEKASFGADAMYLRFKAVEALMATVPTPELAERYVAAARDFLAQYPSHASAPEARYRLGEYLQAQRDFAAAIEEYRHVEGDPGFEVRAAFGTLQSEFELLREARTKPEREALAERIGSGLSRFRDKAASLEKQKSKSDVPLAEFEATVTLFQAAYLSLRGNAADAEIDALLADFPARFAGQQSLLPQAVRMRLGALERLGRFDEAERLAKAHSAAMLHDGRADLVENLANEFVRAAARRRERGAAEEARAAETVARILFEMLPAEAAGQMKRKLTLARLYESAGEIDSAEKAYDEVLRHNGDSVVAIRGLARVAEERRDLRAAAGYWKRFTEMVRPGDQPWYEGNFQQARIALQRGDARAACDKLEELRPAMPGLSDAGLRGQINELHGQACR